MARTSAFNRGVTRGQYNFAQVPSADIPRSVFNRSCGLKTAFDGGDLVPIFVDEALPGDTWTLKTSMFVRMATQVVPVLDNAWVDVFWFAVANRLVWTNWVKFCGEQVDPVDSTDFTVPVSTTTPGSSTLFDYMGLPYGTGAITFNVLPFRAYNLIWNEWFRDENLQDSLTVPLTDGPDSPGYYSVKKRCKRHDYFSSCLPWTQKGTAVSLPLGATAPVIPTGDEKPEFTINSVTGYNLESTATVQTNWSAAAGAQYTAYWDDPKLVADLSSATAATINEIREAFQVQKLLERDARGGTRYQEILRSHFSVISPDMRLQRPEYLGGGSTRIMVNPVATTSDYSTPNVGDLGAYAVAGATGIGFHKSFTEHCYVIGLVNVRADLTYQQGLDRMWSRSTRYDFYWPSLAHLGEQAVLNKEIYHDTVGGTNDDVFGYQERYAEYRYKPSRTTGAMRSQAAPTPLDQWHFALEFGSLPALNSTFIEDNPPFDRATGAPSYPNFLGDFYFDFRCVRPMPTFSVPGLIDHF